MHSPLTGNCLPPSQKKQHLIQRGINITSSLLEVITGIKCTSNVVMGTVKFFKFFKFNPLCSKPKLCSTIFLKRVL